MKMTNEQIKEVLDAFDSEKELQYKTRKGEWIDSNAKCKKSLLYNIYIGHKYRVKPEPRKIELYTKVDYDFELDYCSKEQFHADTHKITYLVDENDEPICESIKLEKL